MPESKYGTGFVETEAILAAQENDQSEVARLVKTMNEYERSELYRATSTLRAVLREEGIHAGAY